MDTNRYAVIVVDRSTGHPRRLGGEYAGQDGADRAHTAAGQIRETSDDVAFVVGLRLGVTTWRGMSTAQVETACGSAEGDAIGLPTVPNDQVDRVAAAAERWFTSHNHAQCGHAACTLAVEFHGRCTECDELVDGMDAETAALHKIVAGAVVLVGCEGYHTPALRAFYADMATHAMNADSAPTTRYGDPVFIDREGFRFITRYELHMRITPCCDTVPTFDVDSSALCCRRCWREVDVALAAAAVPFVVEPPRKELIR